MKCVGYDHIEQTPIVVAKVKKTGEEVKVCKTREFYATGHGPIYWYDVIPRTEKGYWEDDLDFD